MARPFGRGRGDPLEDDSLVAAATETAVAIRCSKCGAVAEARSKRDGEPRLPRGWNRAEKGDAYCGDCWDKTACIRALRFSVAEIMDASWQEWRDFLSPLWGDATALHNWAISQCYLRDDTRDAMPKMGKAPAIYLYPEARSKWPTLPSQSVVSVLQLAQRRYLAARFELRRGTQSLPTYRVPQPLPMPTTCWSQVGAEPILDVACGERHFRLRLKITPRFRPLYEDLRRSVKRGPLTLFAPDLLSLVVYVPRAEPEEREGHTLCIHTPSDALLVAREEEGAELMRVRADHLLRLTAAHDRRLDGLRTDRKTFHDCALGAKPWSEVSRKYRARIKSTVDEAAANVVRLADRKRFGVLSWEGEEEGSYPYFLLRSRLQTLCHERDIRFICAEEALAGDK